MTHPSGQLRLLGTLAVVLLAHGMLLPAARASSGAGAAAAPAGSGLTAVVTGPALSVTLTGAELSGTIDPFGSTSYAFEYGPTTAYGSVTVSQIVPPGPAAVPVSAAVGGLASGTLYHYRLVASSASGTSVGIDRTLTTGGAPGQVPARPGSVSADRTGPRVRILNRALVLTKAGVVRLSLRCPLEETLGCRGRVQLVTVAGLAAGPGRAASRRPLRLGTAAFRIGGGRTRRIAVRLSPARRALVRTRRGLVIRATVTAFDPSGNRGTTARRLRLRSAPR